MLIGAHVDPGDPLTEAAARGATAVQFFLADPQGWARPTPRADAEALRASDVAIFIHAPYVANVATTNNRIRIPSRALVTAHAALAAEIGARGLIVHGGHVTKGIDPSKGVENWRKAFAYAAEEGGFPLPILIENTAGGDRAISKELEGIARLWDAIGEYNPGFCLDTAHAHAAGLDLDTVVDRVTAITGRVDLVHANNARDPFGSGRDRHQNLESGEIDPEAIVEIARAASAPIICETPGGADGQRRDVAFLRERLEA
jgi:deoxyribonuclease-4